MAISLYDASVATYLQIIGGMEGVLAKGLAHFEATGVDPQDVVETRIYPDMLPFRYQIQAMVFHSVAAIQGIKAGEVSPDRHMPEANYASLQKMLADARAGLQSLKPDDVNALMGKNVVFKLGDNALPFTAEGFLLSFSLPNFFFHSTTAYDILRSKGAPLGKRDYVGKLRMKG